MRGYVEGDSDGEGGLGCKFLCLYLFMYVCM